MKGKLTALMMKKDLKSLIDELFKSAYLTAEIDADYQGAFADEGFRKAEYIIEDLHLPPLANYFVFVCHIHIIPQLTRYELYLFRAPLF